MRKEYVSSFIKSLDSKLLNQSTLALGLLFMSIPAVNEIYRSIEGSNQIQKQHPTLLSAYDYSLQRDLILRKNFRNIPFSFSRIPTTLSQAEMEKLTKLDQQFKEAETTRTQTLRATPGFISFDSSLTYGILGTTIASIAALSLENSNKYYKNEETEDDDDEEDI